MREEDRKRMRNIKSLADKAFVAGYLTALDDLNKCSDVADVRFEPPTTTVEWVDGTETSVVDMEYVPGKEDLDPKWYERGMTFAICKRYVPNYVSLVDSWCSKERR